VRCILEARQRLPEIPRVNEPVDLSQVRERLKELADERRKAHIVTIEISEEQARAIVHRLWAGKELLNATRGQEFIIASEEHASVVNEILAPTIHINFNCENCKWMIQTRPEVSESERPTSLSKPITSEEVSKTIADEIGDDWKRTNLHACDLRTCLVTPERRIYLDSFHDNKPLEMWLVLEEDPATHAGYRIVFDETTRQFGLAIEGKDGRDVWLGHYGTFIQTFDGM
jgi:hypothetical protein